MAAKRRRLTDANVAKLAPAAREYTVWDTRRAGLGVRVRHSGHRSFVYCRKGEGGARRIALGPAALMGVEEARARCLEIETAPPGGRPERGAVPTFADFVAGPAQARLDTCKPSTQKSVRLVLNGLLLPAFGPMPLDRIGRIAVTRWFDEYSRTAPGGANRALNVLRQILNHAIDCGHLDTNPTHGIKRNPRPRLTRLLSREEIHRLHRVLDRYAGARPSRAQQADIIRLLLLTGCRKSEIATLRWQDVDADTVNLADAKTGPRKVLLNAPARAILERQPRSNSPWVFPSPLDPGRPQFSDLPLWYAVRREAGIEDVRLHDLRHTFASRALALGEDLTMIGKLLGHKKIQTTARYAHLARDSVKESAALVAASIAADIAVSAAGRLCRSSARGDG